jgi:hypothetical protein
MVLVMKEINNESKSLDEDLKATIKKNCFNVIYKELQDLQHKGPKGT